MTLFMRELKGNMRSFIIWTACIVGINILFMAMYPSFASQGDAVNAMLANFPEEMMRVFSMQTLDFTKADDYFAYAFQYLLIAALIQFMMMGAGLVSREEDEGTISFLYAKPISRMGIIGTKFLAGCFYIAVFYGIFSVTSLAAVAAVAHSDYHPGFVFMLSAAMSLGQLMMLALGMLMSMFMTRARTILSASIGTVLGLYVLAIAVNLKDELAPLRFLTPFKYFDSVTILGAGRIEGVYIVLALAVTAVSGALSLFIYAKRDLKC